MDYTVLKKVVEYGDVYAIAARGIDSVEKLKTILKSNGATGGTLKRRNEFLAGEPAYMSIEGDVLFYDCISLANDLQELTDSLIPQKYQKGAKDRAELEELRKRLSKLKDEKEQCEKKISEQEEHIRNLKAKLDVQVKKELKSELERKVIVASSIKVGPKKHGTDEMFIEDPDDLLDVEKCVARFGGELDSFYNEIPDDEEDTGYDPGRRLSLKNYLLSVMKRIGTEGLFKKRAKESAEIKEKESKVGKLFPGHFDKLDEQQKERHNFIRNRYRALNDVMKNENLTNQEKLMLYGLNSIYHGTNFEKLLLYAGRHCINANCLIEILEDPDTGYNYENTLAFLQQFAEPSEFRMKLNLARDLIVGKWYISAVRLSSSWYLSMSLMSSVWLQVCQ